MDIKDKLRQLDPSSKEKSSRIEAKKDNRDNITSCLGGELKQNQGGTFFKRKQKYHLKYQHGLYPLQEIKNCQQRKFKYIFGNKTRIDNSTLDYRKLLFIDTETTGLAGGTGTVPFMVGLGYFTGEQFVVEQLLMRDFDEELALLEELREIMKDYPVVVSFNGKSYDLPLLKTRLVMNRCNQYDFNCHLDLLHASRRIWSHLSSCSLNSLEEKILSIQRENDLPGSEVPGIYFEYIKSKQPQLLKPIFKHNLIDIVSLVTLLNHLQMVHNEESKTELNGQELFNLGKLYEKEKEVQQSVKYYEKAREKANSLYLRTEIDKKLSWQYKRMEKWRKAVWIWKQMIKENRGGIFPYVELAKFFEHQRGEYKKALKCTKKALAYLKKKRRIKTNFEEKKEDLEHRWERLERKIKEKKLKFTMEKIDNQEFL